MSQAGITRADKAKLLEERGWEREPRKHGEPVRWLDPLGGKTWRTDQAYEMEKGRMP
jgi:hypothetical protein